MLLSSIELIPTPRSASHHSDSMSTVAEADDEYIELLLRKESRHESRVRDFLIDESFRLVRSDAVRWTLKTKSLLGFNMKTAYMALVYFDQFSMHRTIGIVQGKIWAVKLLSVACLTLAAKMEEHRVPALSEFQVEEFRFSSEAIQRMELLVLSTLGWRLSTITPFAYLSYFASKFCKNGKEKIHQATKFIFAAIEVINLVHCLPSVVAIAAVLAASDERVTWKSLESKIREHPSLAPMDLENAFSCYNVIVRGLPNERLKPEKNLVNQSMNNGISISSLIGSRTNSYVMTSGKRRRLQ